MEYPSCGNAISGVEAGFNNVIPLPLTVGNGCVLQPLVIRAAATIRYVSTLYKSG